MYKNEQPKRTKSIAEILYNHPSSFPKTKKNDGIKVAQNSEKQDTKSRFEELKESIYGDAIEQGSESENKKVQEAIENAAKGDVMGTANSLGYWIGSILSRKILENAQEQDRKRHEEQNKR